MGVFMTEGWSAEHLETLKREFALGTSYSLIAEAVGKSRSAVSGKVRRLRELGEIPLEKKEIDENRRVRRAGPANLDLTHQSKEVTSARKTAKRALDEAEAAIREGAPKAKPEKVPFTGAAKGADGRIGFKLISDLHNGRIAVSDAPKAPSLGFFQLVDHADSRHRCRFVYGDLRDGRVLKNEAIYCGEPTIGESPYCPIHTKLCYTLPGANTKAERHGK